MPADCDAVAISTAVRDTNPEVVEARRRGIPVLSRADALRLLVATSPRAIAVSGTHGKTTTTGMVTAVLARRRPAIRASSPAASSPISAPTRVRDTGEWIVVEADESDGTFLELPRDAVLVTNIEPDHLDRWGTFDALVAGFEEFVVGRDRTRVCCASTTPVSARLAARIAVGHLRLRRERRATARPTTAATADGAAFELSVDGAPVATIELRVRGRHNARQRDRRGRARARARRAGRGRRRRSRGLRRDGPSLRVPLAR